MQTDSSVGIPQPSAPLALRLPADLGIEGVVQLKSQLGELIGQSARVVLDAAEVERIHGAALQLFCLFCRDRRAAGREVEFAHPSTTLLAAATLLGAASLLQLARSAA
jgi:ABC-type transporter Mla MlaB component